MPTLMFATKYSSMFSWNSGDMKVSSALDLISGSVMRKGSIWGTWGIRPFSSVSDIVRNRVQGQTLRDQDYCFLFERSFNKVMMCDVTDIEAKVLRVKSLYVKRELSAADIDIKAK